MTTTDNLCNNFAQHSQFRIAVIIPCYNEETTIAEVVENMKLVLPQANIYVFDNNSTDRTAINASAAGAIVHHVALRGKGNVVRRMFADIDADIYVLIDGDGTYHAPSAKDIIKMLIESNLDMVVGTRTHNDRSAYRPGHRLGNHLLTRTMTLIFGGTFTDMLSGYRAFSRRYVKSFPAMSHGFEIETELTIHALELRMPYGEVVTPYGIRPRGSQSKLRTYTDGIRIFNTIVRLFAIERPLRFYGAISLIFVTLAIVISMPLFITYIQSGLVPRLPTALLSTGLSIFSAISFVTGLILENVTIARREVKQLRYLSEAALSHTIELRH